MYPDNFLVYAFYALHYGPVLRKRLNEVTQGEMKRLDGVIDVDLTDCPIVQYSHDGDNNPIVVMALTAEDWVQQGCLRGTLGEWFEVGDRRLALMDAKILAKRMGMEPWWVVEEGQVYSTMGEDGEEELTRVEVERSDGYQRQLEAANEQLSQLMKRMKMKETREWLDVGNELAERMRRMVEDGQHGQVREGGGEE
jgi:hypothetical protein